MEFSHKKAIKNRKLCIVHGCKSTANKNRTLSFHQFPKKGERQVLIKNKLGDDMLCDKLDAWIHLLKMGVKITPNMYVCSLHFSQTDYKSKESDKLRRYLKPTAVPNCNLPASPVHGSVGKLTYEKRILQILREERRNRRQSCQKPLFAQELIVPDKATKTQCTRISAKQTCGSLKTQLHRASINRKNHMTLQTNVQNFEEIHIKQEPLEENTNVYKYMYDDLLQVIVKEENDVECGKDNTNEINTKEQSATLRLNQHKVYNICDKECIEKEKCTLNKNYCSNEYQSYINNDILHTKHSKTNNLINKYRKSYSAPKKFKCSLCDKKFTLNFSLERHMEETHLNMMPEINFPIEEIYIKEEVIEEPPLHSDSYDVLAV